MGAILDFVTMVVVTTIETTKPESRDRACTNSSCLLNVLIGGDLSETFCSRVARKSYFGGRYRLFWNSLRKTFDWIFQKVEEDHCWSCFIRHVQRGLAND